MYRPFFIPLALLLSSTVHVSAWAHPHKIDEPQKIEKVESDVETVIDEKAVDGETLMEKMSNHIVLTPLVRACVRKPNLIVLRKERLFFPGR